jgi:hypothetical protein
LKAIFCGVSLIRGDHLDETKATRLLAVGIAHDLAFLDLAVFLEQPGDLSLSEFRVNAGHEEIRARIDSAVVVFSAVLILGTSTDG